MVRYRRVVAGLIWVTVGIVAGCGGDGGSSATLDTSRSALGEVGSIYRLGVVSNKRPPKDVRDFKAAATAFPSGMKAIGNGEVVVVYNKKLSDDREEPGEGPEGEVIAYEKGTPRNGGLVLMQNRTIKKMTAEEFNAALKVEKN